MIRAAREIRIVRCPSSALDRPLVSDHHEKRVGCVSVGSPTLTITVTLSDVINRVAPFRSSTGKKNGFVGVARRANFVPDH